MNTKTIKVLSLFSSPVKGAIRASRAVPTAIGQTEVHRLMGSSCDPSGSRGRGKAMSIDLVIRGGTVVDVSVRPTCGRWST